MGKVGDGRVCLFACFFCSHCTTAPAPALCVVTLPPPHFPPPPLLPPGRGGPVPWDRNHGVVGQITGQSSPWGSPCEIARGTGTTPAPSRLGARRLRPRGERGWLWALGGLGCTSPCQNSPAAGQGHQGTLRAREVPSGAGRFQQVPSHSRARCLFPRALEKGSWRAPLSFAVSVLV